MEQIPMTGVMLKVTSAVLNLPIPSEK